MRNELALLCNKCDRNQEERWIWKTSQELKKDKKKLINVKSNDEVGVEVCGIKWRRCDQLTNGLV